MSLEIVAKKNPFLNSACDYYPCSRKRPVKLPISNLQSSSITASASSSQIVEFRIPQESVVHLGDTILQMTYTVAASSTASDIPVCIDKGMPEISNFTIATPSNYIINDVSFIQQYACSVAPTEMPQAQFMRNDPSMGLYPCLCDAKFNILPYSKDGLTTGVLNAGSQPFNDMSMLKYGTPGSTLPIQRCYRLKDLVPNTLLDYLPPIALGVDLIIRLTFAPFNSFIFYTRQVDSISLSGNTNTALTASISVTNLFMTIFTEQNLLIRDKVLSDLDKGYTIPVPNTVASRYVVAATQTSGTFLNTVSKSQGTYLKKSYWVPFNASTSNLPTLLDCSNQNGTKVATWNLKLDTRTLQDSPIAVNNAYDSLNPNSWVTSSFDYFQDKIMLWNRLRGSAIPSYSSFVSQNFVYAEYFGVHRKESEEQVDVAPYYRIQDGLALLGQSDHSLEMNVYCPNNSNASSNTNGSSIQLINWNVYTRKMIITSNGVILES